MIGASSALTLSGVPLQDPSRGQGGRIDGEYVLNPTKEEVGLSDMDLFVAGSEDAIIMVEGSAKEIPETEVLNAILFGHRALKPVIELQRKLKTLAEVPERPYDLAKPESSAYEKVETLAREKLREAYQIREKIKRRES